jgi:hypothetical protein
MIDLSAARKIDRSKFFRHRSDYKILKKHLNAQEKVPTRILCAGVGNLEEPTSILATAYQEKMDQGIPTDLSDMIDLDLVESRPAAEIKTSYSFGSSYGGLPEAFISDGDKQKLPQGPRKPWFIDRLPEAFELKDGQYWFAEEVIEASEKAFQEGSFATRIQDFLRTSTTPYQAIFLNNVVQHLGEEGPQVAEDLTKKLLDKDGLVFLHIARDLSDIKSILGTSDLINGNPQFSHLVRVGPAVYRRN